MSTKRKAESHSRPSNKPRTMKPGNSRTDSERDSGFSDASSEYFSTRDTTDSEDSPCPQSSGSGPQPSQLAVVGGSYSSLSPMIIMNNVLLKQPGDNSPALKPWGFNRAMEVVQPVVQQPQMVFIQPVVSSQTSPAPKEATSRRKHSKYLPILKSYPKIAPHPGDSSSGRGTTFSSSSASSYSSYSSSSGSKRGSSVTANHREHSHREKQSRSLCNNVGKSSSSAASLPSTPSTESPLLQYRLSTSTAEASVCSSPAGERPLSALSQSDFTTSLSFSQTPGSKCHTVPFSRMDTEELIPQGETEHGDSETETRRKRFCNTYNILSKSGLLDITLRTKELLKQNRHTQNDLDRLKEHTELFLEALRSGDGSIYTELQAKLQEEDGEKERQRAAQIWLKAD